MTERKLFAALGALISSGIAVWMILLTRHCFPKDPFIELVPGYIIFPGAVLLCGVAWVMLSFPRNR